MNIAMAALVFAQAVPLIVNGQIASHGPDGKQWTIEGDVTTDAGPSIGAHIRGSGPERLADTSTDALGHYVLKGMAPGNFVVYAEKEGTSSSKPKSIQMSEGKRAGAVNFRLGKMAVISGQVLDADRKPVRGAFVSACVKSHHDGRLGLELKQYAATDDLGQYRIADLSEGRYILMINPQRLTPRKRVPVVNRTGMETKRVTASVRATFYPGVESLEAAAPITLSEGTERSGADIVLTRAESFCVRVTIIPPYGEPSAALFLDQPVGDAFPTIAIGEVKAGEESEVCGVSPGEYWLRATVSDPETHKARGFVQTEVSVTNRDVAVGKMYPAPGTGLHGKLVVIGDPNDKSIRTNFSVTLQRHGRPMLYGEELTSAVQPDGSFTIMNVFPDKYGLSVAGLSEGYYLREAKQRGMDVTHGPVEPGRGELIISLAPDGAAISGKTTDNDNQPVPDATVMLMMKNRAGTNSIQTQQSDQSGEFRFKGIAPGEYHVLALTGLFEGEGEDPAMVANQIAAATKVGVEARSFQSVTLKAGSAH